MQRRARGSILWGGFIAVVATLVALVSVALMTDDPTPAAETTTRGSPAQPTTTEPPQTSVSSSAPSSSGAVSDDDTRNDAPADWQVQLDTLSISPEGPRDGYDRDRFRHWIDADRNGCDTRCEVLARQRIDSLPGLPDGGWLSIYDGYSTDNPSEFDVDHLVALSEAWDSGAAAWDDARREAFANDLDSGQLVAVTAATNRSKSDRDPAEWQPPNRDAWCEWATAWVGVKAKWDLTVDRAEVSALRNILQGCG
ncbi:MAG: HNH endonuclease family protein [Microthrixaceae bacterium]